MPHDPRPDLDPTALHQEIEDLTRRLHALVELGVPLAARAGSIVLAPEEYELLLKLAGESPDLLGRSEVTFDEEEPGWKKRRKAFRQKLVDDLADRENLDYRTFCQVLDSVEEDIGAEVPSHVAPAMLSAWLRSGDFEDTRRWRHYDSWSQVSEEDARAVLNAAVDLIVQSRLAIGSRDDELTFWIETVAPEAYLDGRERLEWLAERIAAPSNQGDLGAPSELIEEVVWRWYGDVDDELAERLRALRAIREIATSSSAPSGELFEQLEEAWGNLFTAAPSPEDQAKIAAAVRATVAEAPKSDARADELRLWVVAVAPRIYPDLADRLIWFAETVGRAAGDAPGLPERAVDAVTDAVCEWLDELEKGSIEDVAAVLRTFRRTPMGACVVKADVEASLARLDEAISP